MVAKRTRRAKNVAHREEKRNTSRTLVRKLDGKKHFENQGVDGNIKVGLKVGELRLDSCGYGCGQAAECGAQCNEPSGSTKRGKLITVPRRNSLRGFEFHVCVCVCVCV